MHNSLHPLSTSSIIACHLLDFMMHGKVKEAGESQSIRTPPHSDCWCPHLCYPPIFTLIFFFCHNPPNLSWLGPGTKWCWLAYLVRVARSLVFYGRSRISDPSSRIPDRSRREEQISRILLVRSSRHSTTLWHVKTLCKITIWPIYKDLVYSVSSQKIQWGWAPVIW